MHNFVYLALRRSQEFSREPNFGGVPPDPLAAPLIPLDRPDQTKSADFVGDPGLHVVTGPVESGRARVVEFSYSLFVIHQ